MSDTAEIILTNVIKKLSVRAEFYCERLKKKRTMFL